MRRIIFYFTALLSVIILVYIIVTNLPFNEIKSLLLLLITSTLTAISMAIAIASSKKNNP